MLLTPFYESTPGAKHMNQLNSSNRAGLYLPAQTVLKRTFSFKQSYK